MISQKKQKIYHLQRISMDELSTSGGFSGGGSGGGGDTYNPGSDFMNYAGNRFST